MNAQVHLLFIGDIVGGCGVKTVKQLLPCLRRDYAIDFCIANAENAAGGLGLTGSIAQSLYKAGVDAITLGNHSWSKWELLHWIESDPHMVRPLNGGVAWPGKAYTLLEKEGFRLLVTQVLGSVFMDSCESPFDSLARELPRWKEETQAQAVFVDFHAEASSEKCALAYFLDGRVSAVIGTHTHVQTADERIFPCGTGFLTDVGMTGPSGGVIGLRTDVALRRFVDHLPARFEVADGPGLFQALFLTLDARTGRCLQLKRIQQEVHE